MKKLSLLLLLLYVMSLGLSAQAGRWRAYLSYAEPTEIVETASGRLYVLASGGLYAYDKADQSLQTYDKTTVLSDCGISHIAWCQAARRLVIVYQNGNIDLLDADGNVVNMPEYRDKQIAADKQVYSVDVSGTSAYLATGMGIVQINVAEAEVTNTYRLGFRVDYTYIEGGYLYAAGSTQGLYRGRLTDNLLAPASWTRVAGYTARPRTMDAGLLALVRTLKTGGPQYNDFGFMQMHGGSLYTCVGSETAGRPAAIQVLRDDTWTVYPSDGIAARTGVTYEDLYALAIDPRSPNHLMAAGRNGVYEYRDGTFVAFYNHTNSPIEPYNRTDKEYELVTGLTYTPDGTLWVLNSQAPTQSLMSYTTAGQWESHGKQELMKLTDQGIANKSLGRMGAMTVDSRGLVWWVNNHWVLPSLYAYQPSTDAVNAYTAMYNEDGTRVDFKYVRCVTEDLEGNMWVGTDVGPVYIAPDQITAENPVVTQVKVPRNDGTNYADYLLANVDISCMAVDKAGRKWFGTHGSGVYLISADNMHQVHHFTTANSPLLSDHIRSLALHPETDEVFIGTQLGLCSFQGNATQASEGMTRDNVYAYPNPVRPDYTGAITITGLDEDADVKIVSASGALIHEGRASGGEYRWYGLDRGGRRVASGVYMVEVATAEGEKGVVCRIAVVR